MLTAKIGPTPTIGMSAPATAGPITRARLNCAEFSATALTMSWGGTSEGMNAIHVGPLNPNPRPWASVNVRTTARVACPAAVRMVSRSAAVIMPACAASRILRRFRRSANTPPSGARTMGNVPANETNETQNAEWVSSRTCQATAVVCIQVPVFDSTAPVHSRR